MTFVGTTIIYAYLQAMGVIYSHDEGCFNRYRRLPTKKKRLSHYAFFA